MSALNIFAQPVGERGSGGKDRGPSIVRIDPAFVVKDQVGAFFQREVSDKYFQPGQSATATVSATAPINEEEEDDDDVIEVAAAQVSLSQVKPKVGLQRGGIQNESHSVLRLQRSSMDAPQPTLIDGTLDYEPLPLVKCEPRATIDAMRPRKFEALDGKKTPVPVPHGTSDLTKEWCTLVFRHKGLLGETETVTKAALKPLGDGEGEFSELVLLTLEVDDGKAGAAPKLNRHLVAKFSPPDMSAIELAQVFGTEAHFYNDTSVEAGALTRPEALYVGYLKQRCGPSYYCIIMESAAGTKEQPTVCFKRVDGCSSAGHMRLAMRSLARFHARWWQAKQEGVIKPYAHPDNAGGPLPKLPQCIVHTVAVFMFKNGIKALPRCFSSHPKYDGVPHFASEYAQFIKEIRPVIRRRRHAVVRELFKKPFTLVHGDAHTENIFFGPQYEGGCTWIDFGLLMFGPALGDVATIIAGGMPVEARRQYEEMLLKEYHQALTGEFGVEGYSYEQCLKDYKFQVIKPFFQLLIMAPALAKQRDRRVGMFATPLSKGSQKLTDMYVQLSTRISTALIDHKWKDQVAAMKTTAGPLRPCA